MILEQAIDYALNETVQPPPNGVSIVSVRNVGRGRDVGSHEEITRKGEKGATFISHHLSLTFLPS